MHIIGMYITSRIPNRNALHDDNNKCACLLFSVRSQSAEEIQITAMEDNEDKQRWPKMADK